jgi:hypothetical protein
MARDKHSVGVKPTAQKLDVPESGSTYEDTYGARLHLFQAVAEAEFGAYSVVDAPLNWQPLLYYLGHSSVFERGGYDCRNRVIETQTRADVEAACATEPLLVDALWRSDMVWKTSRRHQNQKVFPIATYSGFYRPEIIEYIEKLRQHRSRATRAVFVPCAADKPYPAPLHKAVMELLPHSGWEIVVISSAIIAAPQGLWDEAPHYDAGLPLFERMSGRWAKEWAESCTYKVTVNYCDMLYGGVNRLFPNTLSGFSPIDTPSSYEPHHTYKNLMTVGRLAALKTVIDYAELGVV